MSGVKTDLFRFKKVSFEQKKFFKKLTKKKKFLLSHFGNSFTADSFCDEETFLQQISQKANPKFSSLYS